MNQTPVAFTTADSQTALAALAKAISQDLAPRYRLLRYVGHGAWATVWQVCDEVTQQTLALKRFEPRRSQSQHTYYQELRTLFRWHHPRLVQAVSMWESSGAQYLLMEFCEGGNLRDLARRVKQPGDCPADLVRDIGWRISQGLLVAHQDEIVHRDIKPENVLFAEPSEHVFPRVESLKLADFGLAKLLSRAAETSPGKPDAAALRPLSGTPAYMAPEQFAGQFSTASDVYALGVMMYELLHGELPWQGLPAPAHAGEALSFHAQLPSAWRELLQRILTVPLHERPTAQQLVQEWLSPKTSSQLGRLRWQAYLQPPAS